MRILLLSYYFPPFNTIGAVRVGKTAKYLRALGHDVHVITASEQGTERNLPVEIPDADISYVDWPTLDSIPARFLARRRARLAGNLTGASEAAVSSSLLARVGKLSRTLVAFPDDVAVGLPRVTAFARTVIERWKPDILFASSSPASVLILASRLAKPHGLPWAGELRDLWTDNHAYPYPEWRRALERRLERFTLSSAAGLVTVSEPLAEVLRGRHHRPTITVTNGFDPADYPETSHPATDGITLLYTGQLFSRQDPSPLIRALALLDASERQQVIVRFVGKFLAMQLAGPLALAESLGVRDRIELLPPVPYRDSLRMQRDADVLVQFSWNDPSQTGVLSGKLFEYIGARRPILLVGATHSLATTLVRERALGVSVENPDAIAVQLRAWLIEKSATGRLPDLPASAGAGLTREDQTRVLEAFLVRLTS